MKSNDSISFPGSLPRLRARLLGLRRPARQRGEELAALGERQLPPARNLVRRHGGGLAEHLTASGPGDPRDPRRSLANDDDAGGVKIASIHRQRAINVEGEDRSAFAFSRSIGKIGCIGKILVRLDSAQGLIRVSGVRSYNYGGH